MSIYHIKSHTNVKLSLQDAIDKFRKIHGDNYDYSHVKYVNNSTKVIIICPCHGMFKQSPAKHFSGQGCPSCGKIRSVKSMSITKKGAKSPKRVTHEDFTIRALSIHGDYYDYGISECDGIQTMMTIGCPLHGEFRQRASKHLLGRGCPKCLKRKQFSKMSEQWLSNLQIPSLIPEYRLPEKAIRVVDGYDPETNTVYQFHGDYFHGNPRKFVPDEYNKLLKQTFGDLYETTNRLDNEILAFGYNLVVKWEMDWKTDIKCV